MSLRLLVPCRYVPDTIRRQIRFSAIGARIEVVPTLESFWLGDAIAQRDHRGDAIAPVRVAMRCVWLSLKCDPTLVSDS